MITSHRNPFVTRALGLIRRQTRERERLFLVEGARPVAEALDCGAAMEEVFVSDGGVNVDPVVAAAARKGIPIHRVSDEVMRRLAATVSPQGVVAVARFVDVSLDAVRPEGCLPVLNEIRDPGNAGTILRSADAAGAAGVVFTRASVDVYKDKTVRASAGSLFHVPVVRVVDLDEALNALRLRGFVVLAADPRADQSLYETDLGRPTAVMFGNEAGGLTDRALACADATVGIPIRGGAESLNVAAAATLFVFEAARQRAAAEPAGNGG